MAQPYSPAPMGAPANSIDHFAVTLDCRGSRLTLDHTRLMELPESVLLCLFPNGVNLGAQRAARADDDGMIEDDEPELYFVDVRHGLSPHLPCPSMLIECHAVRRRVPRLYPLLL